MAPQTLQSNEFSKLKQELEGPPFWSKPQITKLMREDRKIPVSVVRKNSLWSFKGAGFLDAAREFGFEKAKDFDRFRKIPDHFKEVSFNPQTSILHLKIQFLGRARVMDLHMSEQILAHENRIFFRSVKGWLPGLEGVVLLKDQERQQTEAGIIAIYPGKVEWVPDWLFSVAVEGVMHHVAESLRKDLEADYKMSRGERFGVERNQSDQKNSKTSLGP